MKEKLDERLILITELGSIVLKKRAEDLSRRRGSDETYLADEC